MIYKLSDMTISASVRRSELVHKYSFRYGIHSPFPLSFCFRSYHCPVSCFDSAANSWFSTNFIILVLFGLIVQLTNAASIQCWHIQYLFLWTSSLCHNHTHSPPSLCSLFSVILPIFPQDYRRARTQNILLLNSHYCSNYRTSPDHTVHATTTSWCW